MADFSLIIVINHVPDESEFHRLNFCHAFLIQSNHFQYEALNQDCKYYQKLNEY